MLKYMKNVTYSYKSCPANKNKTALRKQMSILNIQNHEKVHGPQVFAVRPVCVAVHVFKFPLEHKELGSVPVRAPFPDKVRICKEFGKADGRGGCKLLSSRCNSTRLLKEDMDDGIAVDKPVAVRSLKTTE